MILNNFMFDDCFMISDDVKLKLKKEHIEELKMHIMKNGLISVLVYRQCATIKVDINDCHYLYPTIVQ